MLIKTETGRDRRRAMIYNFDKTMRSLKPNCREDVGSLSVSPRILCGCFVFRNFQGYPPISLKIKDTE